MPDDKKRDRGQEAYAGWVEVMQSHGRITGDPIPWDSLTEIERMGWNNAAEQVILSL